MPASRTLAAAPATVEFTIRERDDEQPVPCRVHLSDGSGKPVKVEHLPFWKDHFVCDGRASISVPQGEYSYVIERGPEYRPVRGTFDIASGEVRKVDARLHRFIDMAAQGWWSGDLHIHRPVKDIELLMAAEDLHVGPVITWWHGGKWSESTPEGPPLHRFPGERWSYVRSGEDERDGGALLFFGMNEPLPLKEASYHFPPMTASIFEARRRKPDMWIDIEKPFWWEAPLWLATGQVDSIGLANNHMNRSGMLDEEAWGRPRDLERYPSPRGNGFYTQDLYYRVLNCGLRVPPSAGSASGVLPNPVGYNRVYVQLGETFDYQEWWKALKAGRSFVTNGPLLRCRANGESPGHVFTAPAGESVRVNIEVELESNDRVSRVEVIRNGIAVTSIAWDSALRRTILDPILFNASGWFLVRAIADVDHTFRFASTAPYYVQVGDQPIIQSRSAQFFVDWVTQRRGQLTFANPVQRAEALKYYDRALRFWQDRLEAGKALEVEHEP